MRHSRVCSTPRVHRLTSADGTFILLRLCRLGTRADRRCPPRCPAYCNPHGQDALAWQPYGQLVLVRDGPGPYTCVASGSSSLRFGKPLRPSPDPFCADPHAWAASRPTGRKMTPTPTEAIRPLPRAPGLVWMLVGMHGGERPD